MSDYGLFESDEAAQAEPRLAAKTASRKMEAAIEGVRRDFGRFLVASTGIDEFEDRWHLSKNDIRASVEPLVFPNTGTMRKIKNALKADWKLAHPYKLAMDHDEAGFGSMPEGDGPPKNQHLEKTYHPSSGNLIPKADFEGWKDSVDQNGPEKVSENDFTPGGDSGSAKHGYRTAKDEIDDDDAYCYGDCPGNPSGCPRCDADPSESAWDKATGRLYRKDYNGRHDINLEDDYLGNDGVLYTPGKESARRRVARDPKNYDTVGHEYTHINDPAGSPEIMEDEGDHQGVHDYYRDMMEEPPAGYPRRERSMFEDEKPVIRPPYTGPGDLGSFVEEHDHDHLLARREAAALVADIYTDFAKSNGLRVASLDTLDHYASTGIHESDYRLLQSMIVRAAEACEDDDDKEDSDDSDSESDSSDSESDSEAPSSSESDDSDDSDSEDEEYDFGGESGSEADADGDGDHDDDDHHTEDDSDDEEEYDFGGGEQGGGEGGGQQYTVPEQAPELDPQMLNEIPHDNPQGAAPVPPNVIDSLLGLPDGTIEQLLLEEVQQGQGGAPDQGMDPSQGGGDFGGDPGAPQGGGDDFFGGGGGDPEQEPPRVARRRQARQFWAAPDESEDELTERQKREQKDSLDTKHDSWMKSKSSARRFWAEEGSGAPGDPIHLAPGDSVPLAQTPSEGKSYVLDGPAMQLAQPSTSAPSGGSDPDAFAPADTLGVSPHNMQRALGARRFWAADGDQEPSGDSAGGGDSSGGEQQPQGDPAQGGGDPAAMGGQPMMPPPGSQAVTPPAPPAPLENQPAEDALLDTANQAIMQMIDQETAEYQQIIAPLSQALQAVQMAQQVEQTEHPMDVTPPNGSVNVDPSQAPGGAQNPQQQLARLMRQAQTDQRQAKKVRVLKNAAHLIARTYGVSERMLLAAMGRRHYEHLAEAFHILPPEAHQTPEVRAAARHVGKMLAAENPMFNFDTWMESTVGQGMGRAAATGKDRYETKSYTGPRDKRREEHGRQDMAYAQAEDEQNHWEDDPDYRKLYNREGSRSRHPFDRPRLAGETWKNTSTMDRFEFPNEQPEITDNMTINDLPKQSPKGLPKMRHAVDLGTKVQRWLQKQTDSGLNTGGDAMAERYLTEHKNPSSQKGVDEVHQALGATPHAPEPRATLPKAKVPRAVNPTTKKGSWGEWEPTKHASFFTRRVPGWKWDDHLSGYLSKEARSFTCSCGESVGSPSYKTCRCGKIWNVYAIGDSHHLASDTASMYIAREIPVRDNVIMANRKMAGMGGDFCADPFDENCLRSPDDDEYEGHCGVCADRLRDQGRFPGSDDLPDGFCADCDGELGDRGVSLPHHDQHSGEALCEGCANKRHGMGELNPDDYKGWNPDEQPSPDDPRIKGANRKTAKGDGGCTCWEGYERVPGTEPCASGSCRKKTGATARAQATFKQYLAEIERLADWTKYDTPDPARAMGKSKPASTEVSQPPSDWATRLPKGDPSKKGGTWTRPTIPRSKK
jgi:hypothetical protein